MPVPWPCLPLLLALPLVVQDEPPAAPPAPVDAGPRPTLAEIFRPPRLLGLRPESPALSADGRFATFLWTATDAEEPERDLWLVDTASGEARVLGTHDEEVKLHFARQGSLALLQRDGFLDLIDLARPDAEPTPLFGAPDGLDLHWLRDGATLVARTGDEHQLWVIDLPGGTRRAPAAALAQRSAWFEVEERAGLIALFAAPPGAAPAEGAPPAEPRLHLLPLRLPADGSAPAEPRVLDLAPGGTVDLSPDGLFVAVTVTTDDPPRELIMADYLGEVVRPVKVRGALAGDPAPEVTLRLHDVAADRSHDLALDGARRFRTRRTEWSPDGRWLLVDRVSDDHHVRQILVVDPRTRAILPVASEHDAAWIGGPHLWSGWRDDGSELLFTSEASGWNHVHAVAPGGGEARALTAGSFEVAEVRPIRDHDQLLLVAHAPDDPSVTRLHLLAAATGEIADLTGLSGCADDPLVSFDGSTVLYAWSTLGQPHDLHALRLDSAAGPVRLSRSVPEALGELAATAPEIVSFTNPADGVTVRAYLYRPEPFDPSRRYPAVVFAHGAGYLHQVRRGESAYPANMLFHQRLARLGFVVLDPDYRHSKGYGRDFRTAIHGHMGGKDLDDCVAGVEWLGTLGFVDTARVGIYGGSYGGFLALMALFTRPEVFACGAALRPVTDWRSYNPWYTNPRLGDPETDAGNYTRSSPIDHADGLQRPLLLLHGMQDDNVFVQDTVRLIEKLIELGKDFDAMLYPSQGHAFEDPASWIDEYRRIEELFVEELRPGS